MPFVARWPGHIPAGQTSDQQMVHTDLMATLAALVGANLTFDAAEDSFNMLPAYLGEAGAASIRPSMIHHALDGMFALREGEWKLVEGLGSGGFTQPAREEHSESKPMGQLYNLAEDPGETTNLYTTHPDRVARMTALLDQLRNQGYSRPRH